jgi:hypothetical protein
MPTYFLSFCLSATDALKLVPTALASLAECYELLRGRDTSGPYGRYELRPYLLT